MLNINIGKNFAKKWQGLKKNLTFFENGGMPSRQKLGPFLQNKGVQKVEIFKNFNTKSCSPNLIKSLK